MADTHLSLANPKPMDIFGSHWLNHASRMLVQCEKLIQSDDLLLIPGDISWAMKRKDAEVDLKFLATFPGIKVLCKGNHDYWWDSDRPLRFDGLNDTPYVLPGNLLGIAGTRGWIPISPSMSSDEKDSTQHIITREMARLAKRLDSIKMCESKIVMLHYPPIEEFKRILIDNGVSTILYGHLHIGGNEQVLPETWNGMKSLCVASDRINFTPRLVQTIRDSEN